MPLDLLLEIGTEDLPARYVAPLAAALAGGVENGLQRRGVTTGTVRSFATPRRIAVLIAGVAKTQPEQKIEKLGPAVASAFKDGKPTPAALGFARSCGVEFEQIGQKDGKLFFQRSAAGETTAQLLPLIFEETLKQMDELVPKRMRWGSGEETFVRPVQWLVCLFGGEIVPLRRFGCEAGRITYGHRFHAPEAIALSEPGDYEAALRQARVWADLDSRRASIEHQIKQQAALLGGYARITPDLLDEVTALVEWPVVIAGDMEERFMRLPPEVIVATVETNQRYFTLFSDAEHTQLLPCFITIANIESSDVAQVISGNERVVRPRLSDALFFWDQDLKQPLQAHGKNLAQAMFQKDLGSIADKVARMRKLVVQIALKLPNAAPTLAAEADRATQLAKSDLVTKVVYEFPELQGLMGGYYAASSGESEGVARAIREHYLPTQQGTPIPSTKAGQLVSLADKLDSLAGIFAIGQKPTASKDPYALRRAAAGVLRVLIEGELELDLRELLSAALSLQPAGKRDTATADELWNFCTGRFLTLLSDRLWKLAGKLDLEKSASQVPGVIVVEDWPINEIQAAVLATGSTIPLDIAHRADAVFFFMQGPAAAALTAADKRARNILRQAGDQAPFPINTVLFEVPAERALWTGLQLVDHALEPLRARHDYAAMLTVLATLKPLVDEFFEKVMVMADDLEVRANRLLMLARLDKLCREVADLSLLPG
ncbi:MAG: glycine--tRNA ligase subunit beta [Hydrocarboniphaga sp.]|uniref:glycine--tRNA ligase subunit beta n=1 Tax=Hydrocarboniphaga sp. TaxID=2033016 RepID=UPI00263782DA|nr:glycine--tRNA ligase subunit beta [Hydrocarboniphaga sp.]MDB5968567.1 glycine--tRNA ligase subunit beta [Hydrocarboniphaga sp.]